MEKASFAMAGHFLIFDFVLLQHKSGGTKPTRSKSPEPAESVKSTSTGSGSKKKDLPVKFVFLHRTK